MPVRIPTDASVQLQDSLRGIEKRLAALEERRFAPVAGSSTPASSSTDTVVALTNRLAAAEQRLAQLEAGRPYGDEWLEMVPAGPQHARGLTPDPRPNAGLGSELVLHMDGTWRRPLDGLIQVVPSTLKHSHASRVLEILGSLTVAGNVNASRGDFKDVRMLEYVRRALRPYMVAHMSKASTASHTSSGNWQKIPLDTAVEDSDSLIDTVNGKITIKTSGYYNVRAHAHFNAAAGGPFDYRISVSVDGTKTLYGTGLSSTANYMNVLLSNPIRLVANNYLELYAYQNTGGTVTISTGNYLLCLTVEFIGA